ncbi:MAG TPA: S8 family peptidase [Burkholderiales bacterium]|nr:S8 family peptidase [Burkholderiales bacterium]
MADDARRPHLVIDNTSSTQRYTSPSAGGGTRPRIPLRDRANHYSILSGQLNTAKLLSEQVAQRASEVELEPEGIGLQLEFESYPAVKLAVESLDQARAKIELLNVRETDDGRTLATIWVPHGGLQHFEQVLADYFSEKKDVNGKRRDQRTLVDAIAAIRVATLEALWTDDWTVFPQDPEQAIWWEAWLPIRGNRARVLDDFKRFAQSIEARVGPDVLRFPERTVVLVYASRAQLQRSVWLLSTLAELRRAKETAEFFDQLAPEEQSEWVDNLVGRIEPALAGAPHVCLLDTGCTRAHPLLEASIAASDTYTVEPAWGTDDSHGHGTGLAGLALYGNLQHALESADPVRLLARLESVKLLRGEGDNEGRHFGYLTVEATARAEIGAPHRARVFSMAVTTRDGRDRGRPSAWSAAVDRLTSDADNAGAHPRLLVVSAGNVEDQQAMMTYPAHLATDAIHDPGQAWNALTVGACTEKAWISEDDGGDYQPIAPVGGLSPFTTTSSTWTNTDWPWKPDIVMEGGNAGKDAISACSFASLSLLTTYHAVNERLLTVTNATSAASALAANLCATIMGQYPQFWPETVRGLVAHSARWTQSMSSLHYTGANHTVRMTNLLKHCGYGRPDIERALWSASNSLTLIVQDELQPFFKDGSKGIKTCDMHLHSLPWPSDVLMALGETNVHLRVALSYFIEPNPGRLPTGTKFTYPSHGLRFEVRRPTESLQNFTLRINRAARDEEEGPTYRNVQDDGWQIGHQLRRRGSLHADIWEGTAADLAKRGFLAVYPAMGWWRTRTKHEHYNRSVRYSLIVSIETPTVEQDIYAAVQSLIQTPVTV